MCFFYGMGRSERVLARMECLFAQRWNMDRACLLPGFEVEASVYACTTLQDKCGTVLGTPCVVYVLPHYQGTLRRINGGFVFRGENRSSKPHLAG